MPDKINPKCQYLWCNNNIENENSKFCKNCLWEYDHN